MAGSLTRWDPLSELADMRARFDALFEDLGAARRNEWRPAIDVVREDDRLVVHADIPGIRPEEIKIEAADGVLTVSGEHVERRDVEEDRYVRHERRRGAFMRRLALPDGVDPEKISAETRDGVLEVIVPLPAQAQREPVTITPKAAG
jgi:HSP20 family protein